MSAPANAKQELPGCIAVVAVIAVVAYFCAYGLPKSVKPGQEAERERIAEELRRMLPAEYEDQVKFVVYNRPRLSRARAAEMISAAEILIARTRAYRAELIQTAEATEQNRKGYFEYMSPSDKENFAKGLRERAELARQRLAKARELVGIAKLAQKADDWIPGLPALVADELYPPSDTDPANYRAGRDGRGELKLGVAIDPLELERAREILRERRAENEQWQP